MKKINQLTGHQIKLKIVLDKCSEIQLQLGRELTKDEVKQIYNTIFKELNALPKEHLPNFMYHWLSRMVVGFIAFWISIFGFAYLWSRVFHMSGK